MPDKFMDPNDALDAAHLAVLVTAWNTRAGPRVGDWVLMPDGTERRFTHDWGGDIQTTLPHSGDQSFYFARGGMSFSGGLDHSVPKSRLQDTGERKEAIAWFFHHDHHRAHNGVLCRVSARVYRYRGEKSAPC